jgi:RHS repeat-associated protein
MRRSARPSRRPRASCRRSSFTGQERDPEAAQDCFHARYYQPRHGRFGTVDHVWGNLFNPQGLNRYAYALNSPVIVVDPEGLNACATGYYY